MKRFLIIVFLFFLPSLAFASSFSFIAPSVQVSVPKSTISSSYSPNEFYLLAFLKGLEAANKGNKYLPIIEADVRAGAATTTDLTAAFLKQASQSSSFKTQADRESLFGQVFSFMSSLFMPAQAMAAVGLPFGGPLVYAFPCTCEPSVYMILIGPTSNTLNSDKFLNYEIGTQAFGYYDIPRTTWLKGFYEPTGPICYLGAEPYCYAVSSQGLITPVVASSSK